MIETLDRLRERIQAHMAAQGLDVAGLALKSGLSKPTVERIIEGKGKPRFHTVYRLAEGLGVPLEALTAPQGETARLLIALESLDQTSKLNALRLTMRERNRRRQ